MRFRFKLIPWLLVLAFWATPVAAYELRSELRALPVTLLGVAAELFDSTGTAISASNPLPVTGTGLPATAPLQGDASPYANAAAVAGASDVLTLLRNNTTLPTYTDGQYGPPQMTTRGILQTCTTSGASGTCSAVATSNSDSVATTNNSLLVEGQHYVFDGTNWARARASAVGVGIPVVAPPDYTTSAVVTGDAQIKGSAGFLHTCTFSQNDAVPTAGTIIIYNNTTETSPAVFNWNVQATAFTPFTVVLDVSMTTGIYAGFTTTNDVNLVCSYR